MFRKPWLITQEWHDVVFLHWPISPNIVRKQIPLDLELDLFNNMAWIGLIFFKVKGNRLRFVPPLPGLRSFLELNVRTYVKYKGRSGVHVFSLDANNPLIVKLPILVNFLPYRNAKMNLTHDKNTFKIQSRRIHKNTFPETLFTSYEALSTPIELDHLERWLTERYHLWTKTKKHLFRIDISHSPWVLQNVNATIHENTMASFLDSNFQAESPIAHYSKMKKTLIFPPVKES